MTAGDEDMTEADLARALASLAEQAQQGGEVAALVHRLQDLYRLEYSNQSRTRQNEERLTTLTEDREALLIALLVDEIRRDPAAERLAASHKLADLVDLLEVRLGPVDEADADELANLGALLGQRPSRVEEPDE